MEVFPWETGIRMAF